MEETDSSFTVSFLKTVNQCSMLTASPAHLYHVCRMRLREMFLNYTGSRHPITIIKVLSNY